MLSRQSVHGKRYNLIFSKTEPPHLKSSIIRGFLGYSDSQPETDRCSNSTRKQWPPRSRLEAGFLGEKVRKCPDYKARCAANNS
jgi:hypothetical protein